MSSHPSLGRCRVVRARDDVESSRLESMLSRPGSGRFWVVWARADVDLFETEPMSSGLGSGCRVVRARVDVEPSWSASIRLQVESD